jgi:hypothetical protein
MNRSGTVFLSACLLAACGGIAGGDRDATIADCVALCAAQAAAPGCDGATAACDGVCAADGMAFTEDCLVKARAYYDCAAPLAYACPGAPGHAETADTACAAAESAYLLCKIAGR